MRFVPALSNSALYVPQALKHARTDSTSTTVSEEEEEEDDDDDDDDDFLDERIEEYEIKPLLGKGQDTTTMV